MLNSLLKLERNGFLENIPATQQPAKRNLFWNFNPVSS